MLLLAIDVGNTNIVMGVMEEKEIVFTSRVATDRTKTEDEYALVFANIFALRGVDPAKLDGAIISSVVPELRQILQKAVKLFSGHNPIIVGAGVKTGLNIQIDNPAQLGSDLVVDAVAANAEYPRPILIFDMGTATTLSVLDSKGVYRGGMIMPGLKLAVEALSSRTSQLPRIDLSAPDAVVGTNTIDCMRSGAIFGNAAMIDGIIDRVEDYLGEPVGTVVATGGLMGVVAPYCRRKLILDDALMLKGLRIIYNKNK